VRLLVFSQVANCHKRILLLTNNDLPFNPHDGNSRNRAVQKGKDLRDLDIQTELIALGKKPDASGRPKPFNPLSVERMRTARIGHSPFGRRLSRWIPSLFAPRPLTRSLAHSSRPSPFCSPYATAASAAGRCVCV